MKRREEKGITLIALIITIIVMLILVGVTVAVALNEGLFSTTKIASLDTRAEMVREKAEEWKAVKEADEYTNDRKAQTLEELVNDLENQKLITAEEKDTILSEGQVTIGTKTIIFEKDEDLDLLERYFLGENKSGDVDLSNLLYFTDIGSDLIFIKNSIIQDADESMDCIAMQVYDMSSPCYIELTYKQKAYKVWINTETLGVDGVEKIYSLKGREGQKVLYSYDGTEEHLKEWRILHDYGDTVEIISPDVFGPFTIGNGDNLIEWNNAIENLNEYCTNQITNSNKISVRSVGSNPSDPSSEGEFYTSEYLASFEDGKYNGVARGSDENYLDDYRAMCCIDTVCVGEEYFLASRYADINFDSSVDIFVRLLHSFKHPSFAMYEYECLRLPGCHAEPQTSGVRPVVKVNADSVDIID